MNIFRIFCGFLYYFGIARNFVHSTDWIDNLTRYIADDLGARQIKFMTKVGRIRKLESPLIRELSMKLMADIPTWRISFAEHHDGSMMKNSMLDRSIANPFDTEKTLFLLADETNEGLPNSISRKFVDIVAEMASFHYSSISLIISINRVTNASLEGLLKYAWTKKLLDFTIIEVTKDDDGTKHPLEKSTSIYRVDKLRYFQQSIDSSIEPIIHRLNPFAKIYTRINWTKDREKLFPEKRINMHGHQLRIGAVHVPPFSVARFNDNGEPVNIRGVNYDLVGIMAKKLNFSIKYIPIVYDSTYTYENISDPIGHMYTVLAKLEIDLESFLSPNFIKSENNSFRTGTILADKLCAVVPILPKTKIPISRNFLKAYLLSICVVVLYWILKWLFRFKSPIWQPNNIFRVFFGISLNQRPRANTQRILFFSLLVISALYSSAIYASITNANLMTKTEQKFESFEDLDESGLTPILNTLLFNKTFARAKGALLRLKQRSITIVNDQFDCALFTAENKNVTCLTLKRSALASIARINKRGDAALKLAEPCFWSDGLSFILGKRSPYRSAIDRIIMRLHDAGIIGKLYEKKALPWAFDANTRQLERWRRVMKRLRQQLLVILIIGYTLSVLIFVAEIFVFFMSK